VTLDAAMISQLPGSSRVVPFYEELVEPLEAAGRSDLAQCIRRKLVMWRRVGLKAQMARFDREYLNGRFTRIKHLVRL
jgi:hypothetical protein